MQAALWTGNAARLPAEYEELILCREFGWTLTDLDEQDAERVRVLLAMLGAENAVKAQRQKQEAERARSKARAGRQKGRR